MNTRQCTRSVYGYERSYIFIQPLFFCVCFCISVFFYPLPKHVVFICLMFESIFTSDTSSLYLYCHQCPCLTFPLYLEAIFFSRYLTCDPTIIRLRIILRWMPFEHRPFISYFITRLLFSDASADMCLSL